MLLNAFNKTVFDQNRMCEIVLNAWKDNKTIFKL